MDGNLSRRANDNKRFHFHRDQHIHRCSKPDEHSGFHSVDGNFHPQAETDKDTAVFDEPCGHRDVCSLDADRYADVRIDCDSHR
jgi:hypothetical protein